MLNNGELKTGSNEMELVDFRIFKQSGDKVYEGIYGVNVAKVREIIKMPNLTELPGVPEYIEGIFDLRGVVIPVINLAKWMQINEPKDSAIKPRVIIAEFSEILIGFIVHEAKRIRRISWADIEAATFASNAGTLDKGKITGVTRIENDEVLLILDLESVVEENKAQREEEARRAEPIIHDAIEELLDKLSYLTVRPMMALLTEKAERIRRRELHRALAKLPDISDKERRIMDSMSRMIIRKMLREPMIHFNEIAGTEEEGLYWDLFKDMFNLEKEG